MFSFFGLFSDPTSDLQRAITQTWPEVSVAKIAHPISALAVRFGDDRYAPEDESLPKFVHRQVSDLSVHFLGVRFMLLRTECWGGICGNWGAVILDGEQVFRAEGKNALRRLIGYWGADIGDKEISEPLRR